MTRYHPNCQTDLEILANASVNDDPEILRLTLLCVDIQHAIEEASKVGYMPVTVRGADGPFAIVFCETGTNMPHPQVVINAYLACTATDKYFPAMEATWKAV
jgi:hypothetical protein